MENEASCGPTARFEDEVGATGQRDSSNSIVDWYVEGKIRIDELITHLTRASTTPSDALR